MLKWIRRLNILFAFGISLLLINCAAKDESWTKDYGQGCNADNSCPQPTQNQSQSLNDPEATKYTNCSDTFYSQGDSDYASISGSFKVCEHEDTPGKLRITRSDSSAENFCLIPYYAGQDFEDDGGNDVAYFDSPYMNCTAFGEVTYIDTQLGSDYFNYVYIVRQSDFTTFKDLLLGSSDDQPSTHSAYLN